MIVKHFCEVAKSSDTVSSDNWKSVRLLKKDDGMGFSLHETTIFANTETPIWYKHHLEAVYCIGGEGEVELMNGEKHPIQAGTLYALDQNDKHILRAFDNDMRMICVFNPSLRGNETHDKDGAYAPS